MLKNILKHFINSSDLEVVMCYLKLYEDGEVEHINGIWPVLLLKQLYCN